MKFTNITFNESNDKFDFYAHFLNADPNHPNYPHYDNMIEACKVDHNSGLHPRLVIIRGILPDSFLLMQKSCEFFP
jgi:hypothetical protein